MKSLLGTRAVGSESGAGLAGRSLPPGLRLRAYVAGRELASAARVIEQIPGWIEDYNTFAPHSSLGMKTPAEFRREQQTLADTGCLTK